MTRAAFDDEGFYCMGDAVRAVDRQALAKGLIFDGRIKEDFKLSTGTWVSVGPLRARVVTHFAPARGSIAAKFAGSPLNACFVSDLEPQIRRWHPMPHRN